MKEKKNIHSQNLHVHFSFSKEGFHQNCMQQGTIIDMLSQLKPKLSC